MSVLLVGVGFFVAGALMYAIAGTVGVLTIIALYTLMWWGAARDGVFDKSE